MNHFLTSVKILFVYKLQTKSKNKKNPGPPTWKDVRNAYLKSQVPTEDRMQKFSPNRHLEGLGLAIGFIGMLLAISLLLAYVIVQAPQLRRKIGNLKHNCRIRLRNF